MLNDFCAQRDKLVRRAVAFAGIDQPRADFKGKLPFFVPLEQGIGLDAHPVVVLGRRYRAFEKWGKGKNIIAHFIVFFGPRSRAIKLLFPAIKFLPAYFIVFIKNNFKASY